jgi:DNA-binding CsgD family transcriptional regulator
MQDIRYKDVVYEYRSYTYGRYQPKKNEITASAMYFLKEFIRVSGEVIKMEDWLLTKRQNQIMALMSEGMGREEIADSLDIGLTSINTQLNDIYDRYEISGGSKNVKAVVKYLKRIERLKEE